MGWCEFYAQAVHGIVDLRMGRAADLDDTTVRRRAKVEQWCPDHPGCWRLPTHEDSPQARVAAAIRRAGPQALADRYTAFALHELVSSFPTRHHLLLPHGCRVRRHDGIEVRRTRHLDDIDRDEVSGIPAVALPRVFVNAARDQTTAALRSLLLAAVRRDVVDLQDVAAALDRLPRAPGRRRLAQALHDVDGDGSDSGLEFTTRRRMHTAGLRPDDQQPTILVGDTRRRIDIAWMVLRVGVECQGYLHHAGADALDRDAVRLNQLAAEGDWLLLQLTPRMLHDDWESFLADLRRCLRRRAEQLGVPVPPGVA